VKWFDAYEIRARIIPSAIVVSPLIVTLGLALFASLDSLWKAASTTAVGVASCYALSLLLIRGRGSRIEGYLWNTWGGPPSTRFLRWRDNTFGQDLKRNIHSAVETTLRIKLKSETEEREDPTAADQQINDAFHQVRTMIRLKNQDGLWSVHNAEYGFCRNLLANSDIWLSLAGIGVLACGGAWWVIRESAWLFGTVINLILFATALISRRHSLPRACRHAADRYAESAWNAFLTVVREETTANDTTR
jgi:hypothetical protein